LCSGPAHICGQ
jgi:DNA-directed RNA polymerase I, II, and III subunit RPABC2